MREILFLFFYLWVGVGLELFCFRREVGWLDFGVRVGIRVMVFGDWLVGEFVLWVGFF